MKLTIIAKVNQKQNKIEKTGINCFTVWTTKPATENKANEDIIKQLAEYLNISSTRIHLVLGKTSKTKVIQVEG